MISKEKLMFRRRAERELELYWNYAQRFIDERCYREDMNDIWRFFFINPHIGLAVAKNYMISDLKKRNLIIQHMAEPKLSVIAAGVKGAGKTAFSFWAAEQIHEKHGLNVCLFRPLDFNPELLPKYFYFTWEREGIKPKSFIIYDEAAITLSSRRSMSKENIDFSNFLFIQRHSGNPALIIQQVITTTDINVFRMADWFIFKRIGSLQFERETKENDPLYQFLRFLKPLAKNEVLFISSGLDEIYFTTNPLPSFWSDELSTVGKPLQSDDEAFEFAERLLRAGASPKQIKYLLEAKGRPLDIAEIKWLQNKTIGKSKKKKVRK